MSSIPVKQRRRRSSSWKNRGSRPPQRKPGKHQHRYRHRHRHQPQHQHHTSSSFVAGGVGALIPQSRSGSVLFSLLLVSHDVKCDASLFKRIQNTQTQRRRQQSSRPRFFFLGVGYDDRASGTEPPADSEFLHLLRISEFFRFI